MTAILNKIALVFYRRSCATRYRSFSSTDYADFHRFFKRMMEGFLVPNGDLSILFYPQFFFDFF
jgi:hypothetical protein